jgi:hypothetical protein
VSPFQAARVMRFSQKHMILRGHKLEKKVIGSFFSPEAS